MAIQNQDYDKLESLKELVDAVDMGLDIELTLYGKRYNISTDETPFIALCPDGDGNHYKDAEDMVDNHYIDGRLLKDAWKDIQILFM